METSSRREFFRQLACFPLVAGAGRIALSAASGRSAGWAMFQAPGEPQFPNPHFIRYDSHCFTINDRDAFIYSASFHYPRTPKPLWHDRLLKLRLAGFNAIETYVFWNYHELIEGQANMADLEDFIKQVHALGMWLIIRVGPYVCAEWDAGGFPQWILAQEFPVRGDSAKSISTSKHWYDLVLPVVQRSMIEMEGPAIMIQIENEYDYWKLPNEQKLAYIRALAQMVWDAGIDIPIITNWVSQARQNSDPVMARIMDTCDFYPRWNVVKEVVPALVKLRKEEPSCPVGIAELQGGWFSQVGGKLSVDQEGVGADQLNLLTKTVIEQGTTYLNFYMGYGGTNFDWAARSLTTTYDYAAPLREPGGLWEKYYAARGIGAFLDKFGGLLTRAESMQGPIHSTNPTVSVTARVNGKSGFLFVRENANAPQQFKMSFPDPHSPTHRIITVPREGQLAISARGMKMVAAQVPIPGGQLRYSTAEVLSYGYNTDRAYVVIHDDPGSLVEIAVATENEPQVEGEATYQYYDPEYESVVIGFHLDQPVKMFLVNDGLQIIALHRHLALRTWTAEFPATVIPQTQSQNPMDCPFITDCALMTNTASQGNNAWVDLEYAPGEHDVVTLLPLVPDKCTLDGNPIQVQRDSRWRTVRFHISTPPLPLQPLKLTDVKYWVEKFDPAAGEWLNAAPSPLEKLGPVPYGYVKYRATFQSQAGDKLFIDAFTADGIQVFVNGKSVEKLAKPAKSLVIDLLGHGDSGANLLEISYEAFGSANFGPEIQELKGLKSVRVGTDEQSRMISPVQMQRFSPALHGRELNEDYSGGAWQAAQVGAPFSDDLLTPNSTWARAEFPLSSAPQWFAPWKATIEAARDALLYLNGKFVGRYSTLGPQKEFYLPEPYLFLDGKQTNVLTVMLAYTENPQHLHRLEVAPYAEFATRKTEIQFHWEW